MIDQKLQCQVNIVLMGPPGVGKGTVAAYLAEKTNLVHISTGLIFREEIASKSDLGLKIASIVESGKYVPDEITNEVVRRKIAKLQAEGKHIILDGYPRTIEQVHFLDKIDNFNYQVIELYAPSDLIFRRLTGRRQCSKCGANYHVEFMRSNVGPYCEKCGGKLIVRKDDTEEKIKVRQEIYAKETKPLIEHYAQVNKLVRYDASGKVEDLAAAITKKTCKI